MIKKKPKQCYDFFYPTIKSDNEYVFFYFNHNHIYRYTNRYKYFGVVCKSDGKIKVSVEQLSERA